MITTAPKSKAQPSVQTKFVLDAMEDAEKQADERWKSVQESLDLLFTQVGALGDSQQQIAAQLELTAKAVNQNTQDQLLLSKQLKATGDAVASLTMWRMKLEAGSQSDSPRSDVEVLNPFSSSAPGASGHRATTSQTRQNREQVQHHHSYLPKMSFPRFDGTDPRIWKDKCQEYFLLYNIGETMKTSAASLHLDGNAAKWYQVFKLQHGLVSWETFISAVVSKFGAYDYRSALDELMEFRQLGTVEEYTKDFESMRFQVEMHNPGFDEIFFVSQFVRGLKDELRSQVQSQAPESVDRASYLAKIQQHVLEKGKNRYSKSLALQRPNATNTRPDNKPMPVNTPLWKERQLRDFRRANNLCYFCGDKFEPGHIDKCAKRPKPHLNALVVNDLDVQLTEETLNQLEIEDVLTQELCNLSLNALAGTESADSMRVRALVQNQVMLILVDSGSSHSFISADMVQHLKIQPASMSPVPVQLADGGTIVTDKFIPNLQWWAQGNTFTSTMRVLDMSAYDAILGYDWLKSHSPMLCDWEHKSMQFVEQGVQVTLSGVSQPAVDIQELSADQLLKWCSGNEVWALAIVESVEQVESKDTPAEIPVLIDEFSDIFGQPKELPPHRPYDHSIPLQPNATPVNSRPYRYSPLHKNEIERQVKELLASGFITTSTSPFASPVLLVQKKDGSWRFCVDYRRLNELTIKNKFPMPIIEEILEELAGSQYFSSIDLRAGFHQIRMQPADEHKTAFKTHHGHYQFKVMPFGLTNAPATFQCVMNSILEPYLRKFVMVFLDDILIYSPDLPSHVTHLRLVFTLLRKHQFFIKQSKCQFAMQQLHYLGHIIAADGVATDPAKIQAMVQWPVPTNVTELRGFLGLTGYYRRFVKNFGIIAKPLTNLLKKKQFSWSSEAQLAFDRLKSAMTTTPVLALPNFDVPFVIETDACDEGLGAVLMQGGKPVAFLSKALGEKHRHLSIYEKEFMALMMAVDRWRPYLQRQEFQIHTDHKSLTFLEDQQLHSELQKKAMAKLLGLQFRIVYKKGKDNIAADALSRFSHVMALQAISELQPKWILEVINSYNTDLHAQQLLTELAIHSPDDKGYSLHKGIIRLGQQIWIGNNTALRTKLIASCHASAAGGHSGILATYHRLKKMFAWRGMKADVENFVKQCSVCQQAKHEKTHPAGLLQPLPIPAGPWQDISMDFIEGLPKSDGYNSILVVVDRLTKYAHFIPLKHPFTASQVASAVLDHVVKLHGVPDSIVSDRDKIFTSSFWKSLFALLDTKLLMSTSYHPQTDGQTERVNQCLEMYLRCNVHGSPKKWRSWLSLAELWYNTSYHSSLQCSPFKALYGYEPRLASFPVICHDEPQSTELMITERDAHLEMIKKNLLAAQTRIKHQADKLRSDREFQVGDSVLLKLQPYAQSSLVSRPYPKLAFKFFGPYKVLQRVGKAAYKIDLPADCLIHPVFHVSQLKPYTSDYTPVYSDISQLADFSVLDIHPEAVLQRRLVKKGNNAITQVLVKWSHLPAESATWEDWNVVTTRFRASSAWGQASSPGGVM